VFDGFDGFDGFGFYGFGICLIRILWICGSAKDSWFNGFIAPSDPE